MLPFSSKLHTLLVAPYPFVYLVSHEEDRTVRILQSLVDGMQRALAVWTPGPVSRDSEAALTTWLTGLPELAPGSVALAIDAHPYLGCPARVRLLRTLASALTAQRITLVFLAPTPVTPPELAKDWVVLDVPLPDRDELTAVLDTALPPSAYPRLERERLSNAALGLTHREAERAFARAGHLATLTRATGGAPDWEGAVAEEKRRLLASASALEFAVSKTNLDDVGGLDALKQWMHDRRNAFSAEASAFGLPAPKGLMLVGVQGCGKSLAAKAVAGYWGLPLLRLDLGALFSGASAPDDALRAAIQSAEAMSPCVLWVDEVEKGFGVGDGETTRLLGSLLIWLQEKTAPVFFVATANAVDSLPPELLRRGRFDELFFVDLPDLQARTDILRIHLAGRSRDPNAFDAASLAAQCEHFSGAELEQVVIAALYRAFGAGRALTMSDLTLAARELVPLYRLREQEVKALRTWAKDRARSAGHDRSLTDYFGR
jgi:AAA+ superfamily predicted ATPase